MQIQRLHLISFPSPVYITQVIVRRNDLTPTALKTLCNKCSNSTSIITCFLDDATYFIRIHLSQITARRIYIPVLPTVHIWRRSLCGQQSCILENFMHIAQLFIRSFKSRKKYRLRVLGLKLRLQREGKTGTKMQQNLRFL